MSPLADPSDETKATRIGEYIAPPAITAKILGAETKREALDIKLRIKSPNNPKEVAPLK